MRRPFDGTPATITKTTTMKTILGWVQSNVCSLDWALMEYMELVESELDSDDRKRLMANYNMLSTAKTTIAAVSTNLYTTSGIGVTLLLLGFCFAYVRKDGKMSKVGGETSDTDIVYRDRYLNAPGWLGRWRSSWPQRRCVIQRPTRRPVHPNPRALE